MNVLLTGSSGWLGRFLAPQLRESGHEVTGLDVAPGRNTEVIGSVADRPLVDRVFAQHGIDAVIHAGALHKPDIARFSAQWFIDVNITGTLNLLEAAVDSGHERFVMTSTTSLMISQAIRDETASRAIWLDESFAPLAPRNIYGVTKLTAESLCRMQALASALCCTVLRTARFFPEEDDSNRAMPGQNLKANEFLHRRLSVEDAARAHVVALERAPVAGCDVFIVSAPTPFVRGDVDALRRDAAAVITREFPEAADLYARQGWRLPESITRIYDASLIERELGFRCRTNFGSILAALQDERALPFLHDAEYVSPSSTRLILR